MIASNFCRRHASAKRQFEDLESEEFVVEGVRARVATPRTLYRMKKDTVRPQDRLDAQALRERFDLPEE